MLSTRSTPRPSNLWQKGKKQKKEEKVWSYACPHRHRTHVVPNKKQKPVILSLTSIKDKMRYWRRSWKVSKVDKMNDNVDIYVDWLIGGSSARLTLCVQITTTTSRKHHRGAEYWCWACSWGGGRNTIMEIPWHTHWSFVFSRCLNLKTRRGCSMMCWTLKVNSEKFKKHLFHKLLFCTGSEADRKVRSICCSQEGASQALPALCRHKCPDKVRNYPFFHRL